MNTYTRLLAVLLVMFSFSASAQDDANFRPSFHFAPKRGWMNDPNGMFYLNGRHHLYFQHYPDDTKWGPMHWGHASSQDLINWKEHPIAIYPDSLGYIFSGSAVVDHKNTSGFGKNGKPPVVAIYTYHNPKGAEARAVDHQTQAIAYSLDEGLTWTKYTGNPVLKNPGIIDFRDPKVSWNSKANKWIMTLATKDRITFYSSPNLKEWTKESEFGENLGSHGGVWECPDLFPLRYKGQEKWILFVSINPGAPNGGSGTQYFIGDFDGKKFTPMDTVLRWLDPGTDNYAGVTFNNSTRRIFIGWMSNWFYGEKVPTKAWRSATTAPRDLSLGEAAGKLYLKSMPTKEVEKATGKAEELKDDKYKLSKGKGYVKLSRPAKEMKIVVSNEKDDELIIGYDAKQKRYYIDRSKSGYVHFDERFSERMYAPRLANGKDIEIILVFDKTSVEMFADGGLTVMTAIFFPKEPMKLLKIK